MKKELKLLAIWYGFNAIFNVDGDIIYLDENNNSVDIPTQFNLGDTNLINELEQKMIDEIGIKKINIIFEYMQWNYIAYKKTSNERFVAMGKGESIQKAKLNAIINYVKGIKK